MTVLIVFSLCDLFCNGEDRELIRNSKKDRRLTGPPATFYLKILVVGAPGVGKSSIIRRYCGEETLMDYEPTIGVISFCQYFFLVLCIVFIRVYR